MKDLKEALTSTRKPDITHVRAGVRTYIARACEYGSVKYERANFLRPTGGEHHDTPTAEDFRRLRTYLRAMASHAMTTLDAMERHESLDPKLVDVAGMKAAAYCSDIDPDTTGKVGPSRLPHLCGAFASGMMGLEQAIDCGLLPADPGQPWEEIRRAVGPQPGDPGYRYAVPRGEDLAGLAAREALDERDVVRVAGGLAAALDACQKAFADEPESEAEHYFFNGRPR